MGWLVREDVISGPTVNLEVRSKSYFEKDWTSKERVETLRKSVEERVRWRATVRVTKTWPEDRDFGVSGGENLGRKSEAEEGSYRVLSSKLVIFPLKTPECVPLYNLLKIVFSYRVRIVKERDRVKNLVG